MWPVDDEKLEALEDLTAEYESMRARVREIERRLRPGRGDSDGNSGDREPRHPLPTTGAGYIRLELDTDN